MVFQSTLYVFPHFHVAVGFITTVTPEWIKTSLFIKRAIAEEQDGFNTRPRNKFDVIFAFFKVMMAVFYLFESNGDTVKPLRRGQFGSNIKLSHSPFLRGSHL